MAHLLHTRFEQLKRIHLSLDPFTVDDNTLTPTLKIRRCALSYSLIRWSTTNAGVNSFLGRRDAYNKYKVVLDALYELPDLSSSESVSAKL